MKVTHPLVLMTKLDRTQTRIAMVALPEKVISISMTSTIRIKQISRKAIKIMVSTDLVHLFRVLVLIVKECTVVMESR